MAFTRCLNDIKPGQFAHIKQLCTDENMHRRLLDIGLIENTKIKCIGKSPFGDPKAFLIRGAVIAIREEDCKDIMIDD
ncbi:MAG: ferrous iron transport protein A [Clostridia bacterium]|nr:ferrous iron transport protein A [Clostridia bacterium]